jgi:hypothetical protein
MATRLFEPYAPVGVRATFKIVRYVLRRGHPPVDAILLVESGSRRLLERILPNLRQNWGNDIFIDLVTCYSGLPEGFRPETTRVYRVGDYRGRAARRQLYRQLRQNGYAFTGIICSGEPVMTKWKWAVALRVPAKVFVINENADYFWFDRHNWRALRILTLYRSGLAGAGAVKMLAQMAAFPFTLLYLLLYATVVHTRRALRRS